MRTCAAGAYLRTLPPACLRSWTRVNFADMPAIKTGMTNVGGHICFHIGTVSQAIPAAMSQVHRRHMRTRLNVRSNLRRYANLSDPARNPATTPTCSHFSWYTSHGRVGWCSEVVKRSIECDDTPCGTKFLRGFIFAVYVFCILRELIFAIRLMRLVFLAGN